MRMPHDDDHCHERLIFTHDLAFLPLPISPFSADSGRVPEVTENRRNIHPCAVRLATCQYFGTLELRAQLQAFGTFRHDEKLMALPQFVRSDGPYPGPFTFPACSPALRNLSLEGLGPSGPVQEGIKSFVAARQLSDRPVAVQGWDHGCRCRE